MFVSEWLKPEDLGNEDHHVTIDAVEYDMGKRKGSSEASLEYYLRLREYPKKKMGLNRTNAKVIEGILGDETDNWIGKRITIYATEGQVFCSFDSERTCFRVDEGPALTLVTSVGSV